jgi:hypothetical protein
MTDSNDVLKKEQLQLTILNAFAKIKAIEEEIRLNQELYDKTFPIDSEDKELYQLILDRKNLPEEAIRKYPDRFWRRFSCYYWEDRLRGKFLDKKFCMKHKLKRKNDLY